MVPNHLILPENSTGSMDHKMTRNSSGDSTHDKRCVLIAQQLPLQ